MLHREGESAAIIDLNRLGTLELNCRFGVCGVGW